jgi:hypothetical protein
MPGAERYCIKPPYCIEPSTQQQKVQVEVIVKCSDPRQKCTSSPVVTYISQQDFINDNNALLNFLQAQLPTKDWSRLLYHVIGKNNKVLESRVIMNHSTMEYEYFEDLQSVLHEMVGDAISTNKWKFTLYRKP